MRRVSCIGEIFCHSMFPEEGRRSVRSARSKSAGNRLACLPACLPGPACLPSWGIALPYSSNPEPDAGWLDNARYLLDCYDSIQLLLLQKSAFHLLILLELCQLCMNLESFPNGCRFYFF